ncbi:MAG TPA: aspartate aminotransferase, partial [Clostridiales bacterium]|nr:aspartate aminotransferase [Clostridiales bacterium]
MEQVSELAIKHDLIIIADDIYGSYSFSEPFIPMITIDNVRDRTITINSFSKDYAMTGWRIGHVIAPDYIIQTIQQI